jgi:hypothetical protein
MAVDDGLSLERQLIWPREEVGASHDFVSILEIDAVNVT